ncbi:MAG: phosphoserine transaminase [Acidimicrobiia bacterium]
MNEPTPVLIPPDLLPRDGRFGSGPARINPAAVADLAAASSEFLGTSHRKPTVKRVVASIREGLATMYSLPDGYEVVLGLGGATAFWDAAAYGLIDHRSAHFVCGEFSSKFAVVTAGTPHLGEPVLVDAPIGSAPHPTPIDGVDTAAFIHNETSTGVIASFARFADELVVVDATSAAGAISVDIGETDAYYFSPQKALGSEGGLWISLMSHAALERIERLAHADRWIPPFLSLQTAVDNSRKDQTYNTPSLSTLWLLDWQVSHVLDNGGLAWADARSRTTSGTLYAWAEASAYATPFVTDKRFRSPTVVTIDFSEDVDADAVAANLRSNGVLDTESYRKLGRNQLRIAAFPTIDPADAEALTNCIDFVVEAM